MPMRQVCVGVVLGLLAGSGCSKGPDSPEAQPGASQGNEAPPAPVTGSVPMNKLSDGQIAQILATVDTGEIEQAELVLKKSNSPGIRDYATHMIQQHTAAKASGEQLASTTTIKLGASPIAINLEAASDNTVEKLEAAEGEAFDDIYLDAQVQQHTEALTMIDEQLLPAVNEPALRDQLTNARGMVAQHLEQARKLQK
jgi:putative membrane protein